MQRNGFIHGTGAALNVSLGFIPEVLELFNLTDGTPFLTAFLNPVIAFTSGGTTEIKKGDTIRGLTSTTVSAKIREVILDSGSWAGGDAAGWFIFDEEDISGGLFGSENAGLNDSGTNDVTVAAQVVYGITTAAAAASSVALLPYKGDESNNYQKGFTIPSGSSTNGKLFGYRASRNDVGMHQPATVAGAEQTSVW